MTLMESIFKKYSADPLSTLLRWWYRSIPFFLKKNKTKTIKKNEQNQVDFY